jgi:hypothetical protein
MSFGLDSLVRQNHRIIEGDICNPAFARHSRRNVPIRRSAMPFYHGDLGEIGRSRIPIARTRDVKTCP